MEKLAYRPLRYKSRLSLSFTALGVSLFLQNFCSLPFLFGPEFRKFPDLIVTRQISIPGSLGLTISNILLLDVGVSVFLMVLLFWFVNKTLIGKQMRAVAFDKSAASLMGINIDVVISTAFIVGPALAGAAGVLYGTTYGILASPFLGTWPGSRRSLRLFSGHRNIPGAVLWSLHHGNLGSLCDIGQLQPGVWHRFAILIGILLVNQVDGWQVHAGEGVEWSSCESTVLPPISSSSYWPMSLSTALLTGS